ncbi:MAG: RT0821/Lpp0805 family surface protein [Candidatus Thiodiazotropha sp.]
MNNLTPKSGTALIVSMVMTATMVTGCALNREQTGALTGGVVGAAAGSAVGGGSGRTAAIILGALVGTAVGANIGHHMDEQDRMRTAQVFESNKTGESSTWVNPDTRDRYTVTPTRTYEEQGTPCREFTMNANVGDETQKIYGTACRQSDGSWKIVNS